MDLLDILSLI